MKNALCEKQAACHWHIHEHERRKKKLLASDRHAIHRLGKRELILYVENKFQFI